MPRWLLNPESQTVVPDSNGVAVTSVQLGVPLGLNIAVLSNGKGDDKYGRLLPGRSAVADKPTVVSGRRVAHEQLAGITNLSSSKIINLKTILADIKKNTIAI